MPPCTCIYSIVWKHAGTAGLVTLTHKHKQIAVGLNCVKQQLFKQNLLPFFHWTYGHFVFVMCGSLFKVQPHQKQHIAPEGGARSTVWIGNLWLRVRFWPWKQQLTKQSKLRVHLFTSCPWAFSCITHILKDLKQLKSHPVSHRQMYEASLVHMFTKF